jgi:tetratricopeptide (TPR) repeat protein
MKKLLLIFFVFFYLLGISQQNKADSLTAIIDNTINATEKAKLLLARSKSYSNIITKESLNDALLALELAKIDSDTKVQIDACSQVSSVFSRMDEYQKAIDYDLQALSLSEKINYTIGKINSFRNIGRNQKSLGKIKEAIENTEKAKELAVNNKLTEEIANINNVLGIIYRTNSQFQESLNCLNEGISQTKNKNLLAILYMNKANTLTELVRLDEAIENHLQSLKLNEELNNTKGELQVYNNLGNLFKKVQQYNKSIFYYYKSLQLSKKIASESSMALSYDNLATVYDLANKKDSITWFRENAILLFEKINDEKNLARCYHNLGYYQLKKNQITEAEKNLIFSLQKRLKINSPADIASSKISLGILYDKKMEFEKAEFFFMEAKELLKDLATDSKEFLLQSLSNHFKLKGDFENALLNKEEQLKLKDSLYFKNEVLEVITKENKYNIEKKDFQLNELKNVKSQNSSNKFVYGGLIFVVFLLALYSFVRWKKTDFNKRKFEVEIQESEIEKLHITEKHNNAILELQKVKQLVIEDYILLKNKSKVYFNDLIYIKSDGHYLEVFTNTKKEFLRGSITEIFQQLPPNFKQTHRSYIINVNYIKVINANEILMKTNVIIPLTRKYKFQV